MADCAGGREVAPVATLYAPLAMVSEPKAALAPPM